MCVTPAIRLMEKCFLGLDGVSSCDARVPWFRMTGCYSRWEFSVSNEYRHVSGPLGCVPDYSEHHRFPFRRTTKSDQRRAIDEERCMSDITDITDIVLFSTENLMSGVKKEASTSRSEIRLKNVLTF